MPDKPKVFICHATEDKEAVARPLASHLDNFGCEVWYDEFSLKIGDSLRRSIEQGIKSCDFGVVVISPAFFKKEWPQRELDALTARETSERKKLILPIWHGISVAEVIQQSPILADRIAIKTDDGITKAVEAILDVATEGRSKSPLLFWWYSFSVETKEPRKVFDEHLNKLFRSTFSQCDYHGVPINLVQVRDDYDSQLFHHILKACCKGYATRALEIIRSEQGWHVTQINEGKVK